MACSHVETCELFVQFALNPALDIWKRHYCEGDFDTCIRFQKSKSGRQIPLTLLPNGAVIELSVSDHSCGSTAIFNAIIKNRLNMVRSLTKVGCDVNAKNIDGQTPLMAAAQYGRMEIVRFLVDNGANIKATDAYGQTAIDIASKQERTDIVELLERRCGAAPA
jgi:ankyrin repeat protein